MEGVLWCWIGFYGPRMFNWLCTSTLVLLLERCEVLFILYSDIRGLVVYKDVFVNVPKIIVKIFVRFSLSVWLIFDLWLVNSRISLVIN